MQGYLPTNTLDVPGIINMGCQTMHLNMFATYTCWDRIEGWVADLIFALLGSMAVSRSGQICISNYQ